MLQFIDALAQECGQTWHRNVGAPLLQFVARGDRKALELARQQVAKGHSGFYWLQDVWAKLPAPGEFSDVERRALQAAVALGIPEQIAGWLNARLQQDPPDDDACLAAYLEAFEAGEATRQAAVVALFEGVDRLERRDGRPNAAGRFLLSLKDSELAAAGDKAECVRHVLQLLVRHASERLPALARSFLKESRWRPRAVSADCCRLLLEHDSQQFEPLVAESVLKERSADEKARGLEVLAGHFPEKYLDAARQENLAILSTDDEGRDLEAAFRWLVAQFRAEILPDLESYLSSHTSADVLVQNLGTLASELGPAAAPGMIAATRHPDHFVRTEALSSLIQWGDSKHDDIIRETLLAGLEAEDDHLARHISRLGPWAPRSEDDDLVRYIGLAGRWKPQLAAAPLWKLFEHKSKPVRQAVARALAKAGDEAVARAAEHLSAKKAATRSTAVTLLATAQTPAAAATLEARLDDEPDDEVRDQILLSLEQVWEAQGRKVTRADVERRIERAAARLEQPVAQWLDEQRLPDLYYAGRKKEKLSKDAVRYLLYRQSRAKEMRADVEAKPLYALIDRGSSGDFALAVLHAFLAGPMPAEDRWALALAGLLGDDRIVAPLMQQIRGWVDRNRGKMAEYAAQALALLGTDAALCAVDSLAIRYRSKQKNIGRAASESLAEAAERLGVSVEELGDRVVPWLGFEPGRPRVIEQGDKQIEVRIGLDFKLEYRDLVKGKRIASLPAWVPAAVKSEFKELAAMLREVVKGQLARMENLMVRQFRWPVERWRELYLAHPLLFPFAARLAWGLYDDAGNRRTAFRALEDRTLTNEQDETVELPESGAWVGILHPLELSPEERQAWTTHLADYNVESPFPQMERPVVFVAEDEKGVKISPKYDGTELNGMTFKGRAERLGWVRGSVVDAGGISSYRKLFPGAGFEAILELDGMYIGIDMYSGIKLRRFCFVRSESVAFGSYTYDEPRDERDERLVPFGAVPPIVFSESLGDLARIAGDQGEPGE